GDGLEREPVAIRHSAHDTGGPFRALNAPEDVGNYMRRVPEYTRNREGCDCSARDQSRRLPWFCPRTVQPYSYWLRSDPEGFLPDRIDALSLATVGTFLCPAQLIGDSMPESPSTVYYAYG